MAKCKVCGKSMKNDFALKIHMGRMHKGGRPSATVKMKTKASGDLSSVATSSLIGELRRRADVFDRLKGLIE